MTNIETLLHRRPDLSTFLVHFTRERNDKTAHQNLVSILMDGCLKAGSKLGKAKEALSQNAHLSRNGPSLSQNDAPCPKMQYPRPEMGHLSQNGGKRSDTGRPVASVM